METLKINRELTNMFTEISNRLSYRQETLKQYIHQPFSKEAFENQIQLKGENFTLEKRNLLVSELSSAYAAVSTDTKVSHNIQLLGESKTFTITTGHQLSIFTGPVYFIYKILHAVKLSEELKLTYPEFNFVPVFWMASEDHDFEEIQSVSLFNKKLKWETEQKGAVGRFATKTIEDVKNEFSTLFSNHPESEVIKILKKYEGETLGKMTFNLVNELFKSYGLVIVDGDNSRLKKEFSPVIEKELSTGFSFKEVLKMNEELKKENIKLQITPREINLFYIDTNLRSRIELRGNDFYIEGKGILTKIELLKELENNPTAFSPNVVLRPLYQETILPNLCYLGGGGEIAYWLQLKNIFDAVNCPFPLIQVRNSFLQIDEPTAKKMNKTGLSVMDIFKSTEILIKEYIFNTSGEELNFSELDLIVDKLSEQLLNQAETIDVNLKSFILAEINKIEKQILSIKQKFIKTEKSKHEQAIVQLEQIKNKLFPNGGLQERTINFFSLCADGEVYTHLQEIYEMTDPFGNDLIVKI